MIDLEKNKCQRTYIKLHVTCMFNIVQKFGSGLYYKNGDLNPKVWAA